MRTFFSFLKTVIIHPGDISYDFINGRKVSIWVPVSLFILMNFIYCLPVSSSKQDLYSQMNNMPYSHIAKEMVEKKMKDRKSTLANFVSVYWWTRLIVSRALLVINVLLFSLALFIVNYRKNLKFIDHLAVSFEFMALATLYILIVMSWIPVLILTLIATLLLVYTFERMAYRQRPFRSMANAALLVFLFYGVMLVYRSCVFFITMSIL